MTRQCHVTVLALALLAVADDVALGQSNSEYAMELETIELRLDADPGNSDLSFRRAQLLGYIGRDEEALLALDELRSQYPGNVDYALARAQILSRTGRDAEALDDLRVATGLAPDYEAVWRMRFTVLERLSAHAELDALRTEASERFPASDWWRQAATASEVDWTVSVGTQFDSLSNGLSDWNNQTFDVTRSDDGAGTLRAWLWRNQRGSGLEDFAFGFGGETRWRDVWFGGIELTIADSPDFLAERSISVHGGRSFDGGWVADLRYWRREFPADAVDTVVATAERYAGRFRLAYSLSLTQLNGGSTSSGHVGTINWYYDDSSSVGISLTTGQEVESIGAGQVLETDVSGATLSGRHALTDRVGLNWWLGTHEQGDLYRRRFVGMAVSIRI